MTSMPASRSARAMIFAPRSWPSRPGLATTTRIFFVPDGALIARKDRSADDLEGHSHVRLVDRALDLVGARPVERAAEGARVLEAGAELHGAFRDRDVVQVAARPAPGDLRAALDRHRRGAALAHVVVVVDLDAPRGRERLGRRDGGQGRDERGDEQL